MSVVRSGARMGAVAFALGFSVIGPQAFALADTGADTTPGQASLKSPSSTQSSQTTRQREGRAARGPAAGKPSAGAGRALHQSGGAPRPAATAAVRSATGVAVTVRRSAARPALPTSAVSDPVNTSQSPDIALDSAVTAGTDAEFAWDDGNPVMSGPDAIVETLIGIDYEIDNAIYGFLDAVSDCLAMFPVGPVTEFLQGALLLVRRTFFDQAPTLNPVQTTGQTGGVISGTLGGVDPENDPITYSVFLQPDYGTVVVNPDGTFVYTPGAGFDGSDAFIVSATDQTLTDTPKVLQGNWIDPTRPLETDAFVEIDGAVPLAQGVEIDAAPRPKIIFTFKPLNSAAKSTWEKNPKALAMLQDSAYRLAQSFVVTKTINLYYQYGIEKKPNTLGSMQTYYYFGGPKSPKSPKPPVKFPKSRPQAKITDGVLIPGKWDGIIYMNFDKKWSYTNPPAPGHFVFQRTATHELLHSLGFTGSVSEPGCNWTQCDGNVKTRVPKTTWSWYDALISGATGPLAIDRGTRRWSPKPFDRYLTAGNSEGGLFFNGVWAVQAFGARVPLYSPKTFSGSSVYHLSNYYFDNTDLTKPDAIQIMTAGIQAGIKAPVNLSPVEKGILRDLGYRLR